MNNETKPFMHILNKCFEREGEFEIPLVKRQEEDNESNTTITTYRFPKFMLIKNNTRSEREQGRRS
tara:strand:- start:6936 stop:7133 length:198 start_codon:yes stop_codon:yes gene_type:complete